MNKPEIMLLCASSRRKGTSAMLLERIRLVTGGEVIFLPQKGSLLRGQGHAVVGHGNCERHLCGFDIRRTCAYRYRGCFYRRERLCYGQRYSSTEMKRVCPPLDISIPRDLFFAPMTLFQSSSVFIFVLFTSRMTSPG